MLRAATNNDSGGSFLTLPQHAAKVPPLHMPLSRSGQELRSFFYPPQKRTRCSDFQAMRTVRKAFSAFSAADPEPTFGLVRSAVDFCIIVFMSRT